MIMFFIFLMNFGVYSFGFFIAYKNGGIKRNLPFTFLLALFTLYYFITPFYYFLTGRKTIWGPVHEGVGVDITDFYDEGLFYYGLANLLFILGYITIKRKNRIKTFFLRIRNTNKFRRAIICSFIFCYGLVIFNYTNVGVNPFGNLIGTADTVVAGQTATSHFLKNLSDSIIGILIVAYYFRVKKYLFIPLVLISFTLFLLMGFRYRIILTLLGFGCVHVLTTRITLKEVLKYALGVVLFLYFMLFITYNRWIIARGDFANINYNPSEYKVAEVFFHNTRGMLDDITIIKYYETHPSPKYDYGVTFLYFMVRILPRSIVGDDFKDSLYPFPAYIIMNEAYDVAKDWGDANTGEAPLHLAYFYIAGGLPVLLIFSFICGLLTKLFQNSYPPNNHYNLLINVLVTAALFQWVTRGYFPGFVDHLGFLLIGFWMVNFFYRLPRLRLVA